MTTEIITMTAMLNILHNFTAADIHEAIANGHLKTTPTGEVTLRDFNIYICNHLG